RSSNRRPGADHLLGPLLYADHGSASWTNLSGTQIDGLVRPRLYSLLYSVYDEGGPWVCGGHESTEISYRNRGDLWFHVPTPGGEDEGGPALRWVERLKSFHHRPHPRDDVAAGTEFLTGELTELRQHQWVPRIRDDPFAMENAGLIYLNAPVHPDGQVTDDLVDESHSRNRLYPDAVLTGLLDQVPGDTDQPQRMSIKDQSDGPKALVVAVGLY